MTHQAGAYPGFCSMRRVMSISTTPWMGCQSIAGLPPSIKFAGTYLYTLVERGTVRVKCLAQEHNTMSPARARNRTVRSGVEHTNHEATAPPWCQSGRWVIHQPTIDQWHSGLLMLRCISKNESTNCSVTAHFTARNSCFPAWRWYFFSAGRSAQGHE